MARDATRKVLIAGGGVAALEAVLALRELAADRVSIEVLAPEQHFWYRPLAVAAPFELGEAARFELAALVHDLGATFTLGGLTGIDEWRHVAHTSRNTEIPYDTLLVACGAVPFSAIPGALTFRGPADIEAIEDLLVEIVTGGVNSVAFVIPWGSVWSLPAYELALLTATYLEAHGIEGVELALVTPEAEPVQLFGPLASGVVRELLAAHGVTLHSGTSARAFAAGELELVPEGRILADRVVALPQLRGAPIDGLPQTVYGFVPVDSHCRVHGVADVFAAGDVTSFTVKQGGIAAQQADVAARAIAAEAGAPVTPLRFRPVLRGLLLTGGEPRYLRRELGIQPMHPPVVSHEPLWWPPAKIVGHHLAPFLASLVGREEPPSPPDDLDAVRVEIELDDDVLGQLPSRPTFGSEVGPDGTVGESMARAPLLIAPEDTIGEAAERLVEHGDAVAVVAEYGRIIGILTAADLIRAAALRVHPSDARVRQWMTAEPITVSEGTSLADGRALMVAYGIDYLPVVAGERPIGLLHLDDVQQQADVAAIGLGF
jgi:sulfide:quinone oxidoreductase